MRQRSFQQTLKDKLATGETAQSTIGHILRPGTGSAGRRAQAGERLRQASSRQHLGNHASRQ
jgi:hypothetical protein